MRISDLSLDVCSSDLLTCCAARIAFGRASLIWSCPTRLSHLRLPIHQPTQRQIVQKPLAEARPFRSKTEKICGQQQCSAAAVFETENCRSASDHRQRDRKSVGWGKSVSVRVDLGGRCIIKQITDRDHMNILDATTEEQFEGKKSITLVEKRRQNQNT